MNTFLSFLVGPLGAAFQLMDKYQFLPSSENFTEFPELMYEVYFIEHGMPAERMYLMNTGCETEDKGSLIVSKTEMKEILRAREFLDSMVLKDEKMKNATDIEKLNYLNLNFMSCSLARGQKGKKRKTKKIMSKKFLPKSLTDGMMYVAIMCQYKILAREKNFLPLTYDMKEVVQGSICAEEEMYIFMLMDTSHMSVLSILDAEEKMIKEQKEDFIVFNKSQKEEMLKVERRGVKPGRKKSPVRCRRRVLTQLTSKR